MNCRKACEITADYVSDCLPESMRRLYEEHVSSCQECAAELEAMRAMLASIKSLGERRSPVDCWPAIRARVAAESRPTPLYQRFLRPVVAAPVFAVALLLAALFVVPGQISDQPGESPSAIPGYSRYITAHARAQRGQVFNDPDVTFVAAELEKASLSGSSEKP